MSPIHKPQKRALRVISRNFYLSHHIPICYSLNILDLHDIYNVKALSFFHYYFHGKLPPFFHNKIQIYIRSRTNEMLLKSTFHRTHLADSLLFNKLPHIWNSLPNDLKTALYQSKPAFIAKIKKFYISNYRNWSCNELNCYVCNKSQS